MKTSATSEPVVNCFDNSQLLSAGVCVLDLDLNSCSASDCFQMAANWSLSCRRDGRANAAVCWFEIGFDACHKPVAFATGPDGGQTCWKQTAFFLDGSPLVLKTGDKVKGMIAVRKMSETRRNLDIKISFQTKVGKPRLQYYR